MTIKKRLNFNVPADYHKRYKDLADNQEITMSELSMKLIDNFDKIIKEDDKKYE